MSFRRGLIELLIGEYAEEEAIDEAADAGYDTAMDMCGNDGQVSIIDMTGYDAFYDAAEQMAVDGAGPSSTASAEEILIASCPYPEAVSEILGEATGVMAEIIMEARGDALDQYLEDMEDEEDEEEWWD